MLFNTLSFLLFLVVVFVLYWLLPSKCRHLFLLISSIFFYMQWNPFYILLLLLVIFITYSAAISFEYIKTQKRKKIVLAFSIILSLGILGLFKYFNFFIESLNVIFSIATVKPLSFSSRLILPVGISFYTLQSIGYLIDVYRKDIYAEKSFIRYALFVSFFPQLVAGPIERSKNLLKQLNSQKQFSLYNIRKGFILILWGLFVKMNIADRAAIFIDEVYADPNNLSGPYVVLATILFSLQIYCDFYGYSIIAKGSALTLGIDLMNNFNAPYLSQTPKEFWRRWHISLSTWFRDYLYIPLGGGRCSRLRNAINTLVVFGVSGLWHGASMNFVIWGLLNGFFQVVENMIHVKFHFSPRQTSGLKVHFNRLFTFVLITFAWLFFRAGSLTNSIGLLKSVVMTQYWNSHSIFIMLYYQGVYTYFFIPLGLFLLILYIADRFKYSEKDLVAQIINTRPTFQFIVVCFFFWMIIVFGCYGDQYDATSFIYFQF